MFRLFLSKALDSKALINISMEKFSLQKILPGNFFSENSNMRKKLVDAVKISINRLLSEQYFAKTITKLQKEIRKYKIIPSYFLHAFIGYCVVRTACNTIGYPAAINGRSMRPTLNPMPSRVPQEDQHCQGGAAGGHGWGEVGWVDSVGLEEIKFIGDTTWQEWVWVNCWRGIKLDINRGDLLIYISPKDPEEFLIKRVIAMENDLVHTDGRWTEETGNPRLIRIPRGHVWVQGDNLHNTVDSNKYGPVSLGLVVGVATHIVWPLGRIQRLDNERGLLIHSDTLVERYEKSDHRDYSR